MNLTSKLFKKLSRTLKFFFSREKYISILLYHNVGQHPVPGAVSTKKFKKQIKFLNKITTFISIDQAINILKKNSKIDKNYTVLTFDDGTKDFIINTLPFLKTFNIPVIQYISTNWIGKKMPSHSYDYEYEIMDKEDIISISKNNIVTIGSHTLSHKRLTETTKEDCLKELIESKKTLENLTKMKIDHLSYPKGNYDDAILKLVQKSGYLSAVTCDEDINKCNDNLFKLKRKWINKNTTLFGLYLFIKGI